MQTNLLPLFVLGHNNRYPDRTRLSKKRATQLSVKSFILQRCHDTKTKEIGEKAMMSVEGSRNQNKGITKGFDAVIIPKQEELSWIPIPTTAKGLLSNRE